MDRALAFLVFLALFAAYVWTGAPTVTWFDTGELATGAWLLGNGHPPAQPFYVMLAKAVTLIPLGSIPVRVMVLSAAVGAVAMGVLVRSFELVAGRLGLREAPKSVRWVLVPAAGLALPTWLQCVRVELYGLQLLLSAVMLCVASMDVEGRRSRVRRDWLLGLLLGLSAATHPLLGVLLVPGILVLVERFVPASSARLVVGAGVSGSLYLYLPIRARSGALLNWGDPSTWDRFYDVVTGKAYQHSFATLTWARLQHNLELHGALFVSVLGVPLLALALVGLVVGFRKWRVGLGFTLLICGNVASTALQSAFFPDNPDALGYLSFTSSLLFLLAALGLTALWQAVRRRVVPGHARRGVLAGAAWAVVCAIGAVPVMAAWPRVDLRDNWNYQTFVRQLLRPLPLGCLELSASDASTFAGWYGLTVEGMRPDVGVLSLYTLPDTGVFRGGNLPEAFPDVRGTDLGSQVRGLVERLLSIRPVHITMHDLPVDLSAYMRLDVTSFRLVSDRQVPLDDGIASLVQFWVQQAERLKQDPVYLRDRQARLRFPSHLEAAGDYLYDLGLLAPALRAYSTAELFAREPYRLVHLKRLRLEQRVRAVAAGLPGRGADAAGGGDRPGSASPLNDFDPVDVAMHLLELGEWRQADGLLSSVAVETPKTLLARAWVAYLQGRWADAGRFLARLRRGDPVGREAEIALTRLERVLAPGEAVSWMQQYLRVHESACVRARLAERMREAGRVAASLALASTAVKVDSKCVAAHVARGWAFVASGDLPRAFDSLQAALDLAPTDPSALKLASYLYRHGLH